MLKAKFEPSYIDIFHKIVMGAGVEKIPAGTVLMKTGADTVAVSDGTAEWGILSQDVYPSAEGRYATPFNNHEAYDGDFVGIYHGGMHETDQYEDGDYTPGDTLYVSENGKLADEGTVAIGKLVSITNGVMFVKIGN